MRRNSHCFEVDDTRQFLGGDQTLMMRFWKEAQHNISEFYKEPLADMFTILDKYKKIDLQVLKEKKLLELNTLLSKNKDVLNSIEDGSLEIELQETIKSLTDKKATLLEAQVISMEKTNALQLAFQEANYPPEVVNAVFNSLSGYTYSSEYSLKMSIQSALNGDILKSEKLYNKIMTDFITPYKSEIANGKKISREFDTTSSQLFESKKFLKTIKHPELGSSVIEAFKSRSIAIQEDI
jgi:hypothetical protein